MKKEGDVFKRFHETFSKMDGHFHILEQRVPVELQMEYFKYSEDLRKDKMELTEDDYVIFEESLSDPEITTDYKEYILFIKNIFFHRWQHRPRYGRTGCFRNM
ncbi:MAG: hypothetical protein LUD02_03350 [Tannerellaceae bacterium]|nr:hypothetical protein [Tannerellaceae bacterium]MCD8263300.1 hypothetical protein [Tannerellaceae bacterium]